MKGGGGLGVKIEHHKIGVLAEIGQNRIRGGWGVKKTQKTSDINYVRSLTWGLQFIFYCIHPISGIRSLIGKREKVEFAQSVQRYDRKFRGLKIVKRDLIVTQKGIFIIGREKVKTGPNAGQFQEVISRSIPFPQLFQVRNH